MLKKSPKKQSQKSELINDKKKIITASILMSIAAIIYVVIVFYHFEFGLHNCISKYSPELNLLLKRDTSLLRTILPFLMCASAGICIFKMKNKSIRYILGILDIILIVIPIIMVIASTTQTLDHLPEIYSTDFSYCR